jgi:drug/metabolite transporter (DMT)-like permease
MAQDPEGDVRREGHPRPGVSGNFSDEDTVSGAALSLVLASAFGHALWNFHLKRSVDKLTFMCWVLIISGVFLTALWLPFRSGWGRIPTQGWICLLGSGLTHAVYLSCLIRAYDRGDLSIVYPLVRSAPLFLVVWAVLFLGERFAALGLAGIALVMGGLFLLQLRDGSAGRFFAPLRFLNRRPYQLALIGALFLSFGATIDKVGVALVDPFLYAVLFFDILAIFFLVRVLIQRKTRDLLSQWLQSRRRLAVAGILGVPSYALVLAAMSMSQVSYVIASRQICVVIGVILGIWLLGEKHGRIRLAASSLICAGVVLIGLV